MADLCLRRFSAEARVLFGGGVGFGLFLLVAMVFLTPLSRSINRVPGFIQVG